MARVAAFVRYPHGCRRGAAPPVVQKMLGHRDITTTMRYVHTSEDDLDEAIQTTFGPNADEAVARKKEKPSNS